MLCSDVDDVLTVRSSSQLSSVCHQYVMLFFTIFCLFYSHNVVYVMYCIATVVCGLFLCMSLLVSHCLQHFITMSGAITGVPYDITNCLKFVCYVMT